MSRGRVAGNTGMSGSQVLNASALLTARYIIAVVAVTNIGTGRIMPSDGSAKFQCEYTAVVMKPFKGEVVDGKVTIVNKVR